MVNNIGKEGWVLLILQKDDELVLTFSPEIAHTDVPMEVWKVSWIKKRLFFVNW